MNLVSSSLETTTYARGDTAGHAASLSPSDCSEFELNLLRRVARGDSEAFDILHDRYSRRLYYFAARILNDHDEAEDVLQEVFVSIWAKAACFDEAMGKPFSWAIAVTRNKAIDRLRILQRRSEVLEEIGDTALTEAASELQLTENARRDQAEQIWSALNRLADDQRRSIELAFFDGLTHQEIADMLEAPLGTVKARIRRGMARLRDVLKDTRYEFRTASTEVYGRRSGLPTDRLGV